MRFAGRTVLVTGASLGVGRACAHAFHAEGANVAMVARGRGPLEEAAAGSSALVIDADVTDPRAMADALAATCALRGLDGVVGNAGAHFRGPIERRTPEEVGAMVDVNLQAPLVLTRLALPSLRERERAFVVNVASLAGRVLDGAAALGDEVRLRAFSIALGEELRGSGISVSLVSPGPIDTGFIMDQLDEVEDIVFSQRMCSAEHVAAMVLDAASDGRRERTYPAAGGLLATIGYLVPSLRRRLKPLLERKGKRAKARLLLARARRARLIASMIALSAALGRIAAAPRASSGA